MKIVRLFFIKNIFSFKKMVAFICIHLFCLLSVRAANTYHQLSGTISPIIIHHDYLAPLAANLYAYEYRMGFIADGSKEWHNAFNMPSYGFGLSHGYFNNNHLGYTTTLFGFWSFPIIRSNNYLFSFETGFGCAYITNTYNEITNPLNRAISVNWNVDIDFSYSFEYFLTPNISSYCSLGLHHYSNGATKKPNSGINLLYPRIGIKYYPKEREIFELPTSKMAFLRTHYLDFRVACGKKQIDNYEHNYFDAANASIAWEFDFTTRHFTGLGVDYIYDESLKKKQSLISGVKNALYQMGVFGTYGWRLGIFNIYDQLGFYVWHKYDKPLMYNRLGCKLFLAEWCYLNLGLRSQGTRAENFEVGIGYRPKLWQKH